MKRTINCSILTPEKVVYEGDIEFAVVQAHDGEMGFLFNHSALISELGVGEIRLSNDVKTEYLVVEGGIVEFLDNKMIILAESAVKKDDLDSDEIQKQLNELGSTAVDPFSKEGYMITLEKDKLQARLKVASR
ncbi:MAG: ATP synthase F1 subunit epsilon [bacterium]|nr:ATP synthase F1 subunit epsilon [bacterium]